MVQPPAREGQRNAPQTITRQIYGPDTPPSSTHTTSLEEQIGFLAHTVFVDNATANWFFLANAGRWIPPYTIGWIIPLPGGTQVMDVKPIAPPAFVNLTPCVEDSDNAAEYAIVTYTQALHPPVSGVDIGELTNTSKNVFQGTMVTTETVNLITLGGTVQLLARVHRNRRYFFFQNLSANDMWISPTLAGAAAAAPSIQIPAGAVFVQDGTGIHNGGWSVFGTTTNDPFTCLVMPDFNCDNPEDLG